ncbi:Anti-sigma factor [Tsukamurella hominis]
MTAKNDPSLFADNAPGYVAVRPTDVAAQEVFPGIHIQVLWRGDNGATAAVVRIAPGAKWGKDDVHSPGPEEVYVVSGVFNDGQRDYPEGTFMHAPARSWHVPQSEQGCTLFVFYPEG